MADDHRPSGRWPLNIARRRNPLADQRVDERALSRASAADDADDQHSIQPILQFLEAWLDTSPKRRSLEKRRPWAAIGPPNR